MKKLLKEKLKNKFIYLILIAILLIIWFQYFSKPKIDTNTYIVFVKWEIQINEKRLKSEERKKLKIWDIIITKANSATVIEWWDWSLTRLWENWKIEIQELNVEEDLSKINLQFRLINWKTWSNVVSFLWENSYFKQNFEDIEAAVRWTVFDVNLEKDYVYVANHEVSVKRWEKTKLISQNKAFSISRFSFIEIEKFLKNIVDKEWLEKNQNLDTKFLNNLKTNISEKINLKNIDKILKENTTYNELLFQYQKLNFARVTDWKIFEAKNEIKKALISKASEEDKKTLIRYSIYDLKDSLSLDNIDFQWVKALQNIIWDKSSEFKNILWDKIKKLELPNINPNELLDKANKLRDETLNKLFK